MIARSRRLQLPCLVLALAPALCSCGLPGPDGAEADEAQWGKSGFWWGQPAISFATKGEGQPLTDFNDCHSEPTVLWDCTRGEGKVSWSSCGSTQRISAAFVDELEGRLIGCIRSAASSAGHSGTIDAIELHDGGGIISNRTARGSSHVSQHTWGRAMDIDGVTLYPAQRSYSYAGFRSAGRAGKTDDPDYRFFQKLRSCWAGPASMFGFYPGTISWDDDTPAGGHQVRMHLSYPYLLCGGVWE